MSKKTIWITGGSTGIGKALAIKFASKGWNVAVSARRIELLNELSNSYENITIFPLDVTDKLKCKEVFNEIQNKFENDFVSSNSSVEGIANSLARYHMLYGDTNLINNQIDIYRSITREEIKAVANKYLNADQRLLLEYLPEPAQE